MWSPGRAPFARIVSLLSFVFVLWVAFPGTAAAQQKIGYIDSQYILDRLPEYQTVQQKLDQVEQQWRSEIQDARDRVEELRQEYQARELLYTDEEREQRKQEITEARREVESLRQRYFGPDGQLFSRQRELMRPIQERILAAVEEVATSEGYDYVLDQSGDVLFMFARDQYDLSDTVLRELGVDVERQQQDRSATTGNQSPRGNPGGINN
ncbi:MAG: OmpH family outer membrane protein [Bacteroidetes bacterium]|jgi:outer membrane protein|nr:OmpH family outer membrane protein [Bacteroidota bacterium]